MAIVVIKSESAEIQLKFRVILIYGVFYCFSLTIYHGTPILYCTIITVSSNFWLNIMINKILKFSYFIRPYWKYDKYDKIITDFPFQVSLILVILLFSPILRNPSLFAQQTADQLFDDLPEFGQQHVNLNSKVLESFVKFCKVL